VQAEKCRAHPLLGTGGRAGALHLSIRKWKDFFMLMNRLFTAVAIGAIAVAYFLIPYHRVLAADQKELTSNNPKQMEEEFFKMAASGNTLEIRLAKLAEERATEPEIKQAAQMMETDHEQANQLLKRIADQHHIDVSVDELNPVDQAMFDMLQSKQGEQFVHMYLFTQVGVHAQDELILAYHAHHGDSEACRDYSIAVLPKVQMHLNALEQIARPIAGLGSASAQQAADRMAPGQK
jgi:putative membrane protein